MTLATLHERRRELENKLRTIQDNLRNVDDELRAVLSPDAERMLARFHTMRALARRWEQAECEKIGLRALLDAVESEAARAAVAAKLAVADSAIVECQREAREILGSSNVVSIRSRANV
jgi:hypothetical protein